VRSPEDGLGFLDPVLQPRAGRRIIFCPSSAPPLVFGSGGAAVFNRHQMQTRSARPRGPDRGAGSFVGLRRNICDFVGMPFTTRSMPAAYVFGAVAATDPAQRTPGPRTGPSVCPDRFSLS